MKADLQPSQETEAVEGDRVCTDMKVLQEYQNSLQNMLTAVDAAWNKAVSDLEKAVNETKLTFDQNYPDNEELETAIYWMKSTQPHIRLLPMCKQPSQIWTTRS